MPCIRWLLEGLVYSFPPFDGIGYREHDYTLDHDEKKQGGGSKVRFTE